MSGKVHLRPPAQDEFIEAVALRVVELLEQRRHVPQLVDAATLGRMLGISRSTVYEHSAELGGVQLGSGDRKLVRFDVEKALAAWTPCQAGEESQRAETPDLSAQRQRRRKGAAQSGGQLLPIRGQR